MQDLQSLVWAKLDASTLDTQVALLVGAALAGDAAVEQVLAGESPADAQPREAGAARQAPGMYLQRLRVAGFRGIGREAVLDLQPGPGLTVVVGRNGSGKSSFAEAVELAFTGRNSRWDEAKSTTWKEGWRNLHADEQPRIQVDLAVEGKPGLTKVVREWEPEAELDDHQAWAQHHGEPKLPLASLGWDQLLEWYRPFLPYSELGSMLQQEPSGLFDAMTRMLGLDQLVDGQQRLREARLTRERFAKDVKAELEAQKPALQESDDDRAALALQAVARRRWNLDALAELLDVGEGESSESQLTVLRQLSGLEIPNLERIGEVVERLRHAAQAVEAVRGTDGQRAKELADLLERAQMAHQHYDLERCPVCDQGQLDRTWAERVQTQIRQLRRDAAAADEAHLRLDAAQREALHLLTSPPEILAQAASAGLDATAALAAFQRWTAGRAVSGYPEKLADHLDEHALTLVEQVTELRDAALAELQRRESAWRPLAARIERWLPEARSALKRQAEVKALKDAEAWLKARSAEIRDERFEPIAEQCRAVWGTLRQRSNVELGRVVLEGASTRRRVTLDVTVDGVPGAAVGVMSQGELHALALSLFLPRATLDDSPFRFLVVDDPVQAMDPSRVDGLAQVLQGCAEDRQVVVFTHDERLPESLRRLNIDARVLQVDRVSGSQVTVDTYLDPVKRYLGDAWAIAKADELPPGLASSVVPGLCRLALEAACQEVCRRRWIGRGTPHAKVEELLEGAGKFANTMALALFDDQQRNRDVTGRLNRFGRWAGDVYKACNAGAHVGSSADLPALVQDARSLVSKLRALS